MNELDYLRLIYWTGMLGVILKIIQLRKEGKLFGKPKNRKV